MLKTAKCYYSNGDTITTSVNGKLSEEEIINYFLNKWFDIGSYPKEDMQKCVKVEVF